MAKRGRAKKTKQRAKRKPSTKRAPAKPPKKSPKKPKPPASKKKRAAQKAARTREARREESIAASARAASAKKAAATRAARIERETALAQSEQRAVDAGKTSLYLTLENALVELAARSPYPLAVSIEGAPESSRRYATMWLIKGRFEPDGEPLTYDHWADIFAAWESDYTIEATVHPNRLSAIRWDYQRYTERGDEIGSAGGFAAGGAGAWLRVLAEAQQWCDPSINESQSRESTTLVIAVEVLFAADLYTGRIVRVGAK